MLSELNQKKRSNTVWYHLHVESEKAKLIKTVVEWCVSGAGGEEMERCQSRVQTCSYKPNKFWVSNVQHSGYS